MTLSTSTSYLWPLIAGVRVTGKNYCDHTEEYAREQGYEVITLMTNKYMPAFEFYNHVDYIQAEHFVFLFKPV